jgi:hypothetical protein
MRRALVAVAAAVLAGCGDATVRTPGTANATGETASATGRARPESPNRQLRAEPEDSRPPIFDPADAHRTLRWIASVTEQSRRPDPKRTRSADQWKAAQNTLLEAVKQTVHWKLTVDSVNGDGSLLFLPLRTTSFPDHSEKHPEITLRVRPWNTTQLDSPFACPAEPWRSALRAGQDSVTVAGQITGVNTGDMYNWSVALYEIQILPNTNAAPTPEPKSQSAEGFDPEDPDKSFAWLRQQIDPSLDPFATPAEREKRKKEVTSQLRSLTGTKVHWRWPIAVENDYAVATQDIIFADYPRQMGVAMSLWLKNPKSSSPRQPPYVKEFFGAPGSKVINPEVTAKIREAKKATLSGKVAKVLFAEAGAYPPRAYEVGVRLDDVLLEP